MTTARIFAGLFVVAFYCVGFLPRGGAAYWALAAVLTAGFAMLAWRIIHPRRA